jgi:alkaline phosphatase
MKLVKTCFVAALAAGATLATNAEDVRVPNRITLIHSHNDYAQERPFWGAYEAGADSIEADVYLVDGDLLVAHTRKELKKENTLRRLYLEPLREVMRKNGGRARADGKPLQLMVDIKSGKAALDRLLEIVEQEGFRDCFDIVKNPSATRLTVTGDHSKVEDFLAYPDFVFFDVPPTRQLADGQYKRVPLVSQCASAYTRWRSGAMNEADKEKIRNAVRQAHAKGAKFRLWAYPDNPEAWRLAMELGLDYINTDRPADVAAFLRNVEKADPRGE